MNMPLMILAVTLLGLITFLYRFSFISRPGKKIAERIPAAFLLLLAPTAFTAIIVNNILAHQANPGELQQKTAVATLSLAVAYFTRSMLATALFGLVALYLWQKVAGG